MFWTIYNIYLDSLTYIRKNTFVLLPFILFYVGLFLAANWLSDAPRGIVLIQDFVQIVVFSLMDLYVTFLVIKGNVPTKHHISFSKLLGSFILYLMVSLFGWFLFFLLLKVVAVIAGFPDARSSLLELIVMFVVPSSYLIGLRHLVYYNTLVELKSVWGGIIELWRNFFFYFFVILLGMVVAGFPSVLLPVSWSIFPGVLVAESYSGISFGVNWFRIILTPFITTVASIALTYAFLTKNLKEEHSS